MGLISITEDYGTIVSFIIGIFETKGLRGHSRSFARHCSRILADDLGTKMCHNCHVGQGEGTRKGKNFIHIDSDNA